MFVKIPTFRSSKVAPPPKTCSKTRTSIDFHKSNLGDPILWIPWIFRFGLNLQFVFGVTRRVKNDSTDRPFWVWHDVSRVSVPFHLKFRPDSPHFLTQKTSWLASRFSLPISFKFKRKHKCYVFNSFNKSRCQHDVMWFTRKLSLTTLRQHKNAVWTRKTHATVVAVFLMEERLGAQWQMRFIHSVI